MEGNIWDNGLITKCMEKEYLHGQMEEYMKETIMTIKSKDKAYLFGNF